MTQARLALGAAGEARAADWYVARGWEVLARNWRCDIGEIDLVVGRDRVIAFAEVKTRRSAAFGVPAEAVTRTKQARLRRLASRWLEVTELPVRPRELRFDVVSILAGDLTVIEAAF